MSYPDPRYYSSLQERRERKLIAIKFAVLLVIFGVVFVIANL